MANEQLCKDQKVHAFPTLRLFNKRTGLAPDYSSVRFFRCFFWLIIDGRLGVVWCGVMSAPVGVRFPPVPIVNRAGQCNGQYSSPPPRTTWQQPTHSHYRKQDRTVDALSSFITRKLNVEEKRKNWPDRDKEYIEYPGCMVRCCCVVLWCIV